jgi:ribosome maturation factor RimP
MPTSSSSDLHGIDRDALERIVEPIVRAHGAELVEVEFKPERGGWILRLYVEKAGSADRNLSTRDAAVDLELCTRVSRDLSPALDVVDLIPHAYHLEVSSPGIERPLRGERDFVRFTGQKAKLKLREPLPDPRVGATTQRLVIGTLEGVDDDKVRIVEGNRRHEVPISNVESARLIFEFGRNTQLSKH